jgi:hypothetical protein
VQFTASGLACSITFGKGGRGPNGWEPGPDPIRASYTSFAEIADPDGNTWLLQEVPEAAES